MAATGGTVTTYTDSGTDYTIHTFTSNGTLTLSSALTVDYLLVGGGGGGGSSRVVATLAGGGGGAGEYLLKTSFSLSTGSYSITIGAGGTGAPANSGTGSSEGGNSQFGTVVCNGGGGGGTYPHTAGTPTNGRGKDGGSGGGAGGYNGIANSVKASAALGSLGNAGGLENNASTQHGAGGGGAGSVGGNAAAASGVGGTGASNTIQDGTTKWYAAGGGGGNEGRGSNTVAAGGSGIGGTGGNNNVTDGGDAVASTGSGGGGSGRFNRPGGDGSAGIFILRYETPPFPGAPTNLSGTVSTNTVALSWTAPGETGDSAISGYKIEESTDNSSWNTVVADTSSVSTTYTRTVSSAGTYYYKVSAINSAGSGPASSVYTAANVPFANTPNAPTGLSANTASANQITTSWTAPSNNGGAAISGYKIEVSYIGSDVWDTVSANTGNTNTSYVLNEKIGGADYSFKISAINGAGAGSSVTSSISSIPLANTQTLASSAGSVTGTRKLERQNNIYLGYKPLCYYVNGDISLGEMSVAPNAPASGQGGVMFSKADGKVYYKSNTFSGSIINHPLSSHADGLTTTNKIGIGTTPVETLTVSGNTTVSGSLIASGLTFPSGTGSSGQFLGTNGSGTLQFVTVSGISAPTLNTTRTLVYNGTLSSGTQDANDAVRYYCWNTSVDTSDLKYTTGTTQGANSLIHIKAAGDYLIAPNLYVSDGDVNERSYMWLTLALYTGENNNTTRGTLDYEYFMDSMYNRDDQSTRDKSYMGGSLRICVTEAMVSAGCQIEVISRLFYSHTPSGTNNCDSSGSKLHIEKYVYAYS